LWGGGHDLGKTTPEIAASAPWHEACYSLANPREETMKILACSLGALFLVACGGTPPPPQTADDNLAPVEPSAEPVVANATPPESESDETAVPEDPAPEPAPVASAPEPKPAPPPPPTTKSYAGKLLRRSGQKVSLQLSESPATGETCELYRQIDKKVPLLGGGWLSIATVNVDAVKNDRISCTISQEKAQMTLNGGKLDHFTSGVPVRLECTSDSPAPDAS
jgi:hypothetical protein